MAMSLEQFRKYMETRPALRAEDILSHEDAILLTEKGDSYYAGMDACFDFSNKPYGKKPLEEAAQ